MEQNSQVFQLALTNALVRIISTMKQSRMISVGHFSFHFENQFKRIIEGEIETQLDGNYIALIIQQELCNKKLSFLINKLLFGKATLYNPFLDHVRLECRFMTEIDASSSLIADKGVRMIYDAEWKFITHANLSENEISWRGAKIIAKCTWKYLQVLKLNANSIKIKGFCWLLKGQWPKLTILWLVQNGLTPLHPKLLSKISWEKLEQIMLYEEQNHCLFTNSFINALKYMNCASLRLVDLSFSTLSDERQSQQQLELYNCLPKASKPRSTPLQIRHDLRDNNSRAFRNVEKLGHVRLSSI